MERLVVLDDLELLDTPPDPAFDRIVQLASEIFDIASVLISLVDRDRLWMKAKIGSISETPRDIGFCGHALLEPGTLWVTDARLDERFRDNPLVTGKPHIRFYAGAPILVEGRRIGNLCLVDSSPRAFDARQERQLHALAALTAEQCRAHYNAVRLNQALATAETERRKAARSDAEKGALIEAAGDGVIVFDAKGLVRSFNPAAEAIFGFSAPEIIGTSVERLMPDDERLRHARNLARSGVTGLIDWLGVARPGLCRRASGEVFPVELSLTDHDDGATRVFTGVVRDITERKRAEDALTESEAQHRAVVDTAADGIIVIDEQGMILSFNGGAEAMFGYTAAEAVGEDVSLLMTEADRQAHQGYLSRHQSGGEPRTIPVRLLYGRRKNGEAFPLELSVASWCDGDRRRFTGIMRDVTERQRAEARLRQSEERFARLFETSTDALLIMRIPADGTYVFEALNSAFEKGAGIGQEVIGRTVEEALQPEIAATVKAQYDACIASAAPLEVEMAANSPGGVRTWSTTFAAERDPSGRATRIFVFAKDVTERRALEARLLQSQKMEAIAQLAGGVAHDFNNLLLIIDGYTRQALAAHPSEALEEVLQASRRGADLVRHLLVFSRRQVSEISTIKVADAVESAVVLLRPLLGARCALSIRVDPEVESLRIDTDESEFCQALLNLGSNARDAMTGGGVMLIGARKVEAGAELLSRHPHLPPGEYVEIRVEDAGMGMDKTTLARIFEPFFTTKQQGKGTGLGLAMVYGYAQQCGGAVWAESQPGSGTAVKVLLPVSRRAPTVDLAEIDEANAGAGETVLLVEDDEQVLRLTRTILEELGYRVLPAADGLEALEIEAGHEGAIHLVLTDVVMPHLGGFELADILQNSRPDSRIVFMSGYPTRGDLKSVSLPEGARFLQKPFTPSKLARAVRRALADDPEPTVASEAA